MGSAYIGVFYERERAIRYVESKKPSPQSYHLNFRNCNSSVRSLSIRRGDVFIPHATEDPDVENAPVVPEMGTIELRAFRSQFQCAVPFQVDPSNGLHQGRVSERSKKAGWHHVR